MYTAIISATFNNITLFPHNIPNPSYAANLDQV